MKKRFKIPLFIFVILIIAIIALIIFKLSGKGPAESKVKVVDSIDDFSYTLDERDSKLMKKKYNELKEILKAKEIDKAKYAKCIAELFVIDLFTMDNKINKYDVGSTEYVYPSSVENFKTNVEDTIYKMIENNSSGKRKEKLPIVKDIISGDVEEITYKLGSEENAQELSGYKLKLTWEYEKDLGYDKEANITLVEEDNKIYVVEYKVGEDSE